MSNNKSILITGIFVLIFFITALANADVKIITEGIYSDTQLTVNIYADTTINSSDALVSYGIKLSYPTQDLTNPIVTQNDTDWYFGPASSPLLPPNAEPDTSIDGEIVIIGGRIDEPGPTQGVSGEEVLLATVVFDRACENIPAISIGLAKQGRFANFVTDTAEILDGTDRIEFLSVTIDPECNLLCDINGDGCVNLQDYFLFRNDYNSTNPRSDFNGDGVVDMADYIIFQADYGKSCE